MGRITFIIAIVLGVVAGAAYGAESHLTVGVAHNVAADLIAPDGQGPYPGVLVLETSGGQSQADISFARTLAQQGYVCLVPAYLEPYGDTGRDRRAGFTNDADKIYADLVTAAEALQRTALVQGGKIGAVGFSNGGFFATWLAATHTVSAAVSYYGAINGAGTDRDLTRFQGAFNASSAPLLLLVGTEDHYQGPTHHLVRILQAVNSPYQVMFYPGANHEFERRPLGDADRTAATDAWTRTVLFFGQNLKGQ